MKVFIIITDEINGPRECYTSLKEACHTAGVCYWTVVRNWKGYYIGKSATIQEFVVKKQTGKAGNRRR